MPALTPRPCNGEPSATEKFRMYQVQFEHLLANAKPEFLTTPGAVLVCKNEEEASYMRLLLDRRGMGHIATRVAAKLPGHQAKKLFRVARQRAGYKARR